MAIPFKVNLRGLFVRRVSTVTTVVCLALVVAVFSTMMSLAAGLKYTFRNTGDPQNVMVMREGATSEVQSGVTLEQARILGTLPGVAKNSDGTPVATGELVVVVNKNKRGTTSGANVTLRGLSTVGLAAHRELRILEGRPFEPGKSELIASRSIAKKFENCGLGETLALQRRGFRIVGIFEAGGSAHDSELIGDVTDLRDAFKRAGYSVVLLRAAEPSAVAAIQGAIAGDQRLKLKAIPESQYYAEQTRQAAPIQVAGVFLATILAVGAGFGAANTMYAAVSSRSKEIGTLRAIGFSRGAIMIAYLAEALVLGLAGGAVGMVITWLAVDGVTTGTSNWDTFSEVSFAFRVTPLLVALGIAFSAVIGALGGLLPARLAARAPITQALRQI